MKNKDEVELILTRLILFVEGKWCVPVTAQASDGERATADGEMKSWFAAAEQVLLVGGVSGSAAVLCCTPILLCCSVLCG